MYFLFITFKTAMRLRALILFIPFVVFLTETVSFPLHINTRCKTVVCMKMSAMNCPQKKEPGKSPGKCNDSAPCSICPVCSIFVFQFQYTLSIHNNPQPRNYQLLDAERISSYASEIWKPPNNYLLHV